MFHNLEYLSGGDHSITTIADETIEGIGEINKARYMQDKTIVEQIKNKLAEIERTENVRVILAVESGSRSWHCSTYVIR